jgi:hypothetical protein
MTDFPPNKVKYCIESRPDGKCAPRKKEINGFPTEHTEISENGKRKTENGKRRKATADGLHF